jgi:hypothetical protein
VSVAHAADQDIGAVVRRHGGFVDTWRERHEQGCARIAAALRRDMVPVF